MRSPAASTRRLFVGRWPPAPRKTCSGSTKAPSMPLPSSRMDGSRPAVKTAALRSGGGRDTPQLVLKGHTAPVVSLAVRPTARPSLRRAGTAPCACGRCATDGARPGGAPAECQRRRVCAGRARARECGLRPDGADLAPRRRCAPTVVTLPTPLNSVAVAPDGSIVAAGASGKVYFLSADG